MKSFKTILNETLRIKLRGFNATSSNPNVEHFLKDYENSSTIHPFDHKKRILHNVAVHLSKDGNEIHIHDLQSALPNSGNGTKALKHLTSLADKHSIKLNLHAKSYSVLPEHINSSLRLQKWYQKHGFQHDDHETDKRQGADMTYYPK